MPLENGNGVPPRGGETDRMAALRRLVRARVEGEAEPGIVPVPGDGPVPLSMIQAPVWLAAQMDGPGAYLIPLAFELRGALDERALRQALRRVVERHGALRTRFTVEAGVPVQRVHAEPVFGWTRTSVDALPAGERDGAARSLLARELGRPLDLAQDPPLRGVLVEVEPGRMLLGLGIHHLVFDGWSAGIVLRELAAFYAEETGHAAAAPLAPAPQYRDYAAWHNGWLQTDAAREQVRYWAERLRGAPEALALSGDGAECAGTSTAGAKLRVPFPPAAARAVGTLAAAESATPYMVLLAAFCALLHRYTGQDDLPVGTPVANRATPGTRDTVGFFANTLALRVGVAPEEPFRALLGRVRQAVAELQGRQAAPLASVLQALRGEGAAGHGAPFEAMFSFDGPPAALRLSGVTAVPVMVDLGTAPFPLTLAVEGDGDERHAVLHYQTGRFGAAQMERLAAHLFALLEGCVADPGAPVRALPLLDAAERRRVLREWNAAAVPVPPGAGIPALFQARAAQTPDAPALVDGGRTLTYAELNARANRLAHHLRALGVGPETRVGVCLEPSAELAMALLGVLKAGGAYLPLDPAAPRERTARMLADAGVRRVVTRGALADALPEGAGALCLDREAGALAAASADDPRPLAGPGTLAYVIYTSGSTGTPKGVMVQHGSLASHALAVIHRYGLAAGDRVLQFAAPAFDVAAEEMFPTWAAGGTVVLRPEAVPDPETFGAWLAHAGVTVANLPAPFWARWVDALHARGEALPPPLRVVVTGSDAVPPRAVEAWTGMAGGRVRLFNAYGPTETTITATAWEADGASRPTAPIGRAVANTRAYVVDAAGQPCPAGVAGELWIGGPQVARGYQGRPSLTAERFVPDPFCGVPGARAYRTGDRARWRVEGELEFLGRVDHQVKVRGFRIEPGEVEAALAGAPGVRECVVVARDDAPGDRRLVAYVAGEADAAELRARLRERLPEYMVPSAFVVLDALPLTPTGKVDRRALPAPAPAGDADAYEAPRTATEELLCGIFAGVLGAGRVGAQDHFFELGGHSLLAMQVLSRIRQVLGVELPVRALFAHPTARGLAGAVEAARRGEQPAGAPLVPVQRTAPPPLSFAQQRLWVLDRLQPGSSFYNIPTAVRLRGALNAGALERALAEIVRRHESLRTVFRVDDAGDPVQGILPAPERWNLPVSDLSAQDADDRETSLQRLASEDAERPFDLAEGPLFRAALVRLGDDDHALLVCVHHAVSDGWSMGVLFDELAALYAAFARGEPSPLPDLPVQYADYAVWQREHLRGETLDAQVEYWRARLSGAPTLLELPSDRPRPPVQSHRGAALRWRYAPELRDALQALARGEGATVYMVLLAAFQVLLSKYARQEDVVVGSPIAGRTRAEVEGLIGFFANTLALRTDLSGDPSFREVLARVRETTLDAYAHQELPFEKLVEELNPERSLSHSPVFQVLFVLQNDAGGGPRLEGVDAQPVNAAWNSAKFDLSLYMAEAQDGLRCWMEYATDLFDASTVERMLAHLGVLLDAVAADPARRIGRLPLLAAEERAQVLDAWNATAADHPRGSTIHQRFGEQAGRTPDSVAVVHVSGELTYGELDARANRLAHYLRGLGVGAETRVAICVDRGAEMMVALLGVLKAGAAYVPLDPSYPAERLAFVLSDASVPVLLTQAHLESSLPDHGARVVRLDADWDEIARSSAEAPRVDVGADSAAYVIYTSGSTGRPKGVVVYHGAVVNFLHSMQREPGLSSGDTLLALTTLSFDIAGLELYLPLITGARVLLATQEEARDPALLREKIASANVIQATPASWRMLLASGWTPDAHLKLLCGGEALPRELADQLLAGGAEVWNLYGPTEATIWATAHRVVGGDETTVSIGRPIANTRVYILDAAGEPTPVGVPGELLIGGVQVARGYLNRPALTAERFIPDPFGAEPGGRLYRTGDLARWTERTDALTHSRTHALEFLRRLDFQVKVRGFRIELGEIESVLSRDPAVREAVVIVREDTPGDARLVAYVVADEEIDASALRTRLRGHLPEYMVPAAVVVLEALPLTPNGKVDRKALPAPEAGAGQGEYAAPRTPTEEEMARVWAEVLGVERVGAEDNFFELGGHSLLATRVMSLLPGRFGVELPLRELFARPTVRALAGAVEEALLEQAPGDELAALLAQLAGMDDDEAGGLAAVLGITDQQATRDP